MKILMTLFTSILMLSCINNQEKTKTYYRKTIQSSDFSKDDFNSFYNQVRTIKIDDCVELKSDSLKKPDTFLTIEDGSKLTLSEWDCQNSHYLGYSTDELNHMVIVKFGPNVDECDLFIISDTNYKQMIWSLISNDNFILNQLSEDVPPIKR